jgi:hypothetical protein
MFALAGQGRPPKPPESHFRRLKPWPKHWLYSPSSLLRLLQFGHRRRKTPAAAANGSGASDKKMLFINGLRDMTETERSVAAKNGLSFY